MKTCIVYYSLNGNTEDTARRLAALTGADLIKLEPVRAYPSKGLAKFLFGGKSSLMEETPALKPYEFDAGKYDTVVFGYPVWASNVTPPVRTFIQENAEELADKKIAVFACQAGSGAEKTFAKLEEALRGKKPECTLVLNDPLKNRTEDNERKLRSFAASVVK